MKLIKVGITFMVFQNNKLDEEVEITQEFPSWWALIKTITKFAAQENAMRLDPLVRPLYTQETVSFNLPPLRQGYGPGTNIVLKEIHYIDPD